jgi:ABC-type branched-subunit amino acid transport system substrate-binding protein
VQAYDAAGIILRALNSKDLASRSALRDQLINLGAYKGISGNFSFSETGVNRSAYLLTVKGSSIAEVEAK